MAEYWYDRLRRQIKEEGVPSIRGYMRQTGLRFYAARTRLRTAQSKTEPKGLVYDRALFYAYVPRVEEFAKQGAMLAALGRKT